MMEHKLGFRTINTHTSVSLSLSRCELGNIRGWPEHNIQTLKPLRSQFFFYCGCILKLLIVSSVPSAPVLQPCDVFEQPHPAGPKKIEFHISVPEATSTVERSGPGQEESADGVQGKVFLHLNGEFFYF